MSICYCGKEIEKGIQCKNCYAKEWRKNNPDKQGAINRRHYLKYRREHIADAEKWNKKHSEKHKQSNRISHDKWVERNRERWNNYQRDYRKKKA